MSQSKRSRRYSRCGRGTRHLNLSGRRWYRLPEQGKIAGVCAGVAERFQVGSWMVRLMAITCLLFIPGIIIPVYLLAIFLLPTPSSIAEDENTILDEMDATTRQRQEKSRRFDEALDDQEQDFHSLDRKRSVVQQYKRSFDTLEQRLQSLERHVTSRQFELNREINSL